MQNDKPMTVGDLIAVLKKYNESLLVVLSVETSDSNVINTFVTKPSVSLRGRRQTYLGDRDVLRIQFSEDEP